MSRIRNYPIIGSALAVAVVLGSTALSAASAPAKAGVAASTTLRVAQNAYALSPSVVAAGNANPKSYKLQFINFEAAPQGIAALLSGSVDLVQASAVGTMAAELAHDPVKVVGAGYQAPEQYQLVVPSNSKIKTISQLKGKTIAVFKASAGEGFLIAALKKQGLTEADVHIVNMEPPAAEAALAKGSIDAWAIWEPYVSEAKLKLKARVISQASDSWKPIVFLLTNQQTLADPAKLSALKQFIASYKASTNWVKTHPVPYGKAYAKATQLPQNIALQAAPHGTVTVVPINSTLEGAYKQQAKLFQSGGLFPSVPSNLTSIFDPVLNSSLK